MPRQGQSWCLRFTFWDTPSPSRHFQRGEGGADFCPCVYRIYPWGEDECHF